MSDEADSILEGVLGEGIRFRSGRRRVQRIAAEAGIPWRDFLDLVQTVGLPGTDPDSQTAWTARAQAFVGARGLKAIDWNALIQALITALPALLAICGG
jgi:hypothetical protein